MCGGRTDGIRVKLLGYQAWSLEVAPDPVHAPPIDQDPAVEQHHHRQLLAGHPDPFQQRPALWESTG
ncbi:MAG TPA: hypothetical protein VJ140_09570 [Actinomycetota bacterium]|nr:hypothetical protein [Actinomycetota bacterium]